MMERFTALVITVMGVLGILASFFATTQSGEFGSTKRPQFPISRAQRVVMFIGGVVILIEGVRMLIA